MDEQEWLNGKYVDRMLAFLTDRLNARKLRLFAVACCRRMPREYVDDRVWCAVEVAERFADCQATEAELDVATSAAEAVVAALPFLSAGYEWPAVLATLENPCDALVVAESSQEVSVQHETWARESQGIESPEAIEVYEKEEVVQTHLLRDIFGNPFRPVSVEDRWRTPTILAGARQMYDSRDFSDMSRLADALHDAGCDNRDILDHCRGPGPHVRGCWVLDLLLGKT